MMTAYKALGFDIEDSPNAYDMYRNEVTLPLHTRLTDEDIDYCPYEFYRNSSPNNTPLETHVRSHSK